MTWTDKENAEVGANYLKMLDAIEAGTMFDFFKDVEGDDSEGRVTGRFVCGVCGMRSFDPDHPETCCLPAMRAAGLVEGGR